MSGATMSRVLEAVQECATVFVIGFGEPTLSPDFLPFLQELDRLQLTTTFSTNGTTVDHELVEKLSELRHLQHANVSIDSPDPEIYRMIRGGELNQALRGLKLLREGLRDSIDVTVTSLILASNLDSLFSFPPLLADLGIRTFNLGGVYEMAPGLEDQRPYDVERYTESLYAIRAAGRELGVDVVLVCERSRDKARLYYYPVEPSDHLTRQCSLPWTKPFIDKNGYIYPCSVCDHTAMMGSLGESSFQEIWKGKRFQQFRRDLLAGGARLPSSCRRCSMRPMVRPSPIAEYEGAQPPTRARRKSRKVRSNRLLSTEEVLDGKLRLTSTPLQINIDLTGICNVNPPCVFCSGKNFGHSYPHLDPSYLERYQYFIDRAERITDDSFGEPLSHPQMIDLARRFTSNGQLFSFVTNGLLLDRRKAEALVACGADLGIHVSFNAACAGTFYKLTGKRFDLLVENLRYYVDLYRQRYREVPPHLILTFIVMKANQHEVIDFLLLAWKLGVPRVLLASLHNRPSVPLGHFGYDFRYEDEMLPYDELETVGRRATTFAKEIGLECLLQWDATQDSAIQGFAEPGCEIRCLIPWRYIFIQEHSRRVFGCPYHRHPYGDLDQTSIEDIWNGPQALAMRRELVAGSIPKLCRDVSAACPLLMRARHRGDHDMQIEDHLTMGLNDAWHAGTGWYPLEHVPEPIRWTSREASFRIHRPDRGQLIVEAGLFHEAHHIHGSIELECQRLGSFSISGPCWETLRFPLPAGEAGVVDGRILIDETWSPAYEGSTDTRQLGVAVSGVWFESLSR
jgi:radical SAM protein with 4Fe4S-binding SPASM domain